MKRLLLLVTLTGCASFPQSLRLWEDAKAIRLAACITQKPANREEACRCLGRDYMRDLGDETSAAAHLWLASLPEGK